MDAPTVVRKRFTAAVCRRGHRRGVVSCIELASSRSLPFARRKRLRREVHLAPGRHRFAATSDAAEVVAMGAARGITVSHQRHSIPDLGAPGPAQMVATLDAIDAALDGGQTVYVHCFGGIGRTGTVVGCWLVRHGLSGAAALAHIAAQRAGTPDGARPSPETAAQRAMILNWQEGQ